MPAQSQECYSNVGSLSDLSVKFLLNEIFVFTKVFHNPNSGLFEQTREKRNAYYHPWLTQESITLKQRSVQLPA